MREPTAEGFKHFKPLAKANAPLLAKLKRGIGERGAEKAPTKVPISIRVSPEAVEYFRAKGKGWQGQTRKDGKLEST